MNRIILSSRNVFGMPAIEDAKRLSQSIATLDAILEPEWEYRYYSFNSKWDQSKAMASMRNGSGDDYFLLFTPAGAIIKGFAHESAMAQFHSVQSGIYKDVPEAFASFLTEPAFDIECATFCLWRRYADEGWKTSAMTLPEGNDPDGSEDLLKMFDGLPQTYQTWAEEYFERPVPLAAVEHIYGYQPVTPAFLNAYSLDRNFSELLPDLEEIGYPFLCP